MSGIFLGLLLLLAVSQIAKCQFYGSEEFYKVGRLYRNKGFYNTGGTACESNANCSIFDYCVQGRCIPLHYGCPNNTCLPNEVCIRGQCQEIPVPRPCQNDAQCSIFEYCLKNSCVPDNRDCPNGTCPPKMVCVNRICMPNPLLPIPSTTEAAEPSTVLTTTTHEIVTVKPTSPPVQPCRAGWIYLREFKACYFMVLGSVNYWQANFACQSLGVYLLALESREEMNKVNDLMGGTPYWIGARFYGVWFWQNGITPFTYQNWAAGQPDGCCGKDVTCVLVNMAGTSGFWYDAGCDEWHKPNQGYVCKEFL